MNFVVLKTDTRVDRCQLADKIKNKIIENVNHGNFEVIVIEASPFTRTLVLSDSAADIAAALSLLDSNGFVRA